MCPWAGRGGWVRQEKRRGKAGRRAGSEVRSEVGQDHVAGDEGALVGVDRSAPRVAQPGHSYEMLDAGGGRYDLVRSGGEITLLDMFAFRYGHVDDEDGSEGNTWGAGVTLQYRKAVGARFDWARVPADAGSTSSELDRYGITVFIEPLRFDASGGLK